MSQRPARHRSGTIASAALALLGLLAAFVASATPMLYGAHRGWTAGSRSRRLTGLVRRSVTRSPSGASRRVCATRPTCRRTRPAGSGAARPTRVSSCRRQRRHGEAGRPEGLVFGVSGDWASGTDLSDDIGNIFNVAQAFEGNDGAPLQPLHPAVASRRPSRPQGGALRDRRRLPPRSRRCEPRQRHAQSHPQCRAEKRARCHGLSQHDLGRARHRRADWTRCRCRPALSTRTPI